MRPAAPRPTQVDRRSRSRAALLEAAARRISRSGYANLNLAEVARDAGFTRGAIYHQFATKEELALAVVAWVEETWYAEIGPLFDQGYAADAVRAVARAHAVYCRRDVARVMTALRVELAASDGPLARATATTIGRVVRDCTRLIERGRADGSIPPGPTSETLALAVIGALEGLVISLTGRVPDDEVLAERAVDGLLGLVPSSGADVRRR